MTPTPAIRVLCVDDNQHVAEALRIKLRLAGGFDWAGWLPSADDLVEQIAGDCPDVVIVDVDMPGRNPFDAILELAENCPNTRALMFSGYVRPELVDRALEAGAWGYVSKNDGEEFLIRAIRAVASGEFSLSPEAAAATEH